MNSNSFPSPKSELKQSIFAEQWEVEDVQIPKNVEIIEYHPAKNFSKCGESEIKFFKNTLENEQTFAGIARSNKIFSYEKSLETQFFTLSAKSKHKRRNVSIELHQKEQFLTEANLSRVKKFIEKLKENATYQTTKFLKSLHFDLINDWAFFPINSLNTKEKFNNVFVPTNKFMLFWNFIMMLLTIYNLIILPLRIAFEKEDFFKQTIYFSYLSAYIFLIDFFKNLNTAFYDKGELIISRKIILIHYLMNGKLFFDFISFLCLISDYSTNFLKLTSILFLLRLKNLSSFMTKFEEFIFSSENSESICRFIRMIFIILLFSHWVASFYIFVGKLENSKGWMDFNMIQNSDILTQYISSLYYIVGIMTNVGFAHSVVYTTMEKIFMTCFFVFSSIISAYIIYQIGKILLNIEKNEQEFKTIMKSINGYMRGKNIPNELKLRIRNYLEYYKNSEQKQNETEINNILNKLSKNIKDELIFTASQAALKKIPIFMKNFSEKSLKRIGREMTELNLKPNDFIYHQNERNSLNVYIVRKGEVGIVLETTRAEKNKPVLLKILKSDECFGEFSFFTGFPRQTGAKSLSFSSLFVIKQEDFLKVLSENTKDYEKFCSIRDQINVSNNFEDLQRNCFSCGDQNHMEMNCPKLHPIFSKNRVIRNYISNKYADSVFQKRMSFQRHADKKQFNSLGHLSLLKTHATNISKKLFKNEENDEIKWEFEEDDFQQNDDTLSIIKAIIRPEFSPKHEDHSEYHSPKETEQYLPSSMSQNENKYRKKDFEHVKSFENYFPGSNIEQIISKINAPLTKKEKCLQSEKSIKSTKSHFKIKKIEKNDSPLLKCTAETKSTTKIIRPKLKISEKMQSYFIYLKKSFFYLLQSCSRIKHRIKNKCVNIFGREKNK